MKHKLLFDTVPLVILPKLAVAIGLNESIVLQQIHYWLRHNKAKDINFHDGRYWTYNSVEKWTRENFPWWSGDTVKRTLASLRKPDEKRGRGPLLLTANYNKAGFDKTLWYSIDYDEFDCVVGGMPQALGQNAPMEEGKMPQPIPETNTEITAEQSHQASSSVAEKKPTTTAAPKVTHPSRQVQRRKAGGKKAKQAREKPAVQKGESDVVFVPESNPPLCPDCGTPLRHWRKTSTGEEWYNHKTADGYSKSWTAGELGLGKGARMVLVIDDYGINDRVEWRANE